MRKSRWSASATRHGATPTPATPRPASPPRCAARASRPATESRSSAPTESSSSKSYSAAPGLARWRCRSTSPRAGPQLQHILSNCGARLLVLEDVHADNLAMLDARRLAVEAIWLIGAKGRSRFRQRHRGSDAARRRAYRGRGGPARRSRPHSLHLWYHRPVERRLLPACAILLVGGQYGVAPATARRRRAVHQPAAVSHQRAEHLLPGAARPAPACVTRSGFPLPGFFRRWCKAAPPSPICSAPWCRSCCRGRCPRKKPHIRSALRSRPACRRSFTPISRGVPACACLTAGAQPKPISSSARRSSTSSPD